MIPPIPDPAHIPVEFTLTHRGREAWKVDPSSDLANEQFLIYESDNFLVFSSPLDLQTLHGSEYWVADGTFEMVPKNYAQLYSIHGFKNGEGVVA